jgi:hypothetical protein
MEVNLIMDHANGVRAPPVAMVRSKFSMAKRYLRSLHDPASTHELTTNREGEHEIHEQVEDQARRTAHVERNDDSTNRA